MSENDVVNVIFRVMDGDVIALFPDIAENYMGRKDYCVSYAHIGQHSAADYHGCIMASRPATESEYASLARELKTIGYTLQIRSRRSRR